MSLGIEKIRLYPQSFEILKNRNIKKGREIKKLTK